MPYRLRPDDGSFRDPSGRVYRVFGDRGEAVVRGLNRDAADSMAKLLAEAAAPSLSPRFEVNRSEAEAAGRQVLAGADVDPEEWTESSQVTSGSSGRCWARPRSPSSPGAGSCA